MAMSTAHFPFGHFPAGAFPDGHWPKPPVYPVSLDEIKIHLRVIDNTDDMLISQLILAAVSWAELFQRRLFISRAVTMKMEEFPAEIRPCFSPLVSVGAIKYIDTAGAEQTLSSANYRVDTDTEPGRITEAYGCSWPAIRQVTGAVTVEYTAGYGSAADVPDDIKSAIMLLVGHWYENRSTIAESQNIKVPQAAKALLWKRKLVA